MSESPPDSPLPGGGRRIARPASQTPPDEAPAATSTGTDAPIDSTTAEQAPTPGRRARRAPGPALTHLPENRAEGGRRRARVPGDPDVPAAPDPTQQPAPAESTARPSVEARGDQGSRSWTSGAATAAELSGGSAVDEGYAAARAARRRQTPAARVSVPRPEPVQPSRVSDARPTTEAEPEPASDDVPPSEDVAASEDFSDLRPHAFPRELLEPEPAVPEPTVESAPAVPEPTVESAPAVLEPPAEPAQATPSPVRPAPRIPARPVAPAAEPITSTLPALAPASVAPTRGGLADPTPPPDGAEEEPATDDVNLDREESGLLARESRRVTALLVLLILGGTVAAGTRIAAAQDWISTTGQTARIGALIATWAAIVTLTRRCGGRVVVIGAFAAAMAVVVAAFPERWALAGAATAAAVGFGLLGMVLTRPQRGARTLLELLLSAFIGLSGAVVVSGYDVVLRPYRFRILVLSIVLVAALALAWRLGHGRRSIGRRGAVVIVFGVVALVASVAYAQAIRSWGSPGLLQGIRDFDGWLSSTFGASPWPVEALVGFPLLVWGVAFRRRNRQGWWMCAFGALGAAGLTSSLVQTTTLGESLASSGYSVLIGGAIGLVAIALDRMLTGGGGRKADASAAAQADRQEPPRFAPLL